MYASSILMRFEIIIRVGPTQDLSIFVTTSVTRSRSSGKRVSSVVSHCSAMR